MIFHLGFICGQLIAGTGIEPIFSGYESDVLPLDQPAVYADILSGLGAG